MCDFTEREKQILKLLATKETKAVALEMKTTRNAIYQALHNIRRKEAESRNYVNRMNALRKNPRLRRLLLPVVRPPPEPLPEID